MANESILLFQDPDHQHINVLTALMRSGYATQFAATLEEALYCLQQFPCDLLIVSLDERDAECPWCQELRQATRAPILLLASGTNPSAIVNALARGADFYLTATTATIVIEAQIAAVLRWRARNANGWREDVQSTTFYRDDHLLIDIARRWVVLDGRELAITPKEFSLLQTLLENAGRPVTYDQLLAAGWPRGDGDINSVHTHISHLRRKLGDSARHPRYIVGDHGIGYRFVRQGF